VILNCVQRMSRAFPATRSLRNHRTCGGTSIPSVVTLMCMRFSRGILDIFSFGSPGLARCRIFINSMALARASLIGSVVVDFPGRATEEVEEETAGVPLDGACGKCFARSACAAGFFSDFDKGSGPLQAWELACRCSTQKAPLHLTQTPSFRSSTVDFAPSKAEESVGFVQLTTSHSARLAHSVNGDLEIEEAAAHGECLSVAT